MQEDQYNENQQSVILSYKICFNILLTMSDLTIMCIIIWMKSYSAKKTVTVISVISSGCNTCLYFESSSLSPSVNVPDGGARPVYWCSFDEYPVGTQRQAATHNFLGSLQISLREQINYIRRAYNKHCDNSNISDDSILLRSTG